MGRPPTDTTMWNRYYSLAEDVPRFALSKMNRNLKHKNAWCKLHVNHEMAKVTEEQLRALEPVHGVAMDGMEKQRRKLYLAMQSVEPVRGTSEATSSHDKACEFRSDLLPTPPSTAAAPSTSTQTTLKVVKATNRTRQEVVEFKKDIFEVVVATNLPFSWVDEAIVRRLFDKWTPGLPLPHRTAIGTTMLDSAITTLDGECEETVKGEVATISADHWTSQNKKNLLGVCLNVDGDIYATQLEDCTAEEKTGDNAYKRLDAEIIRLNELGVEIVAVCTDAGSDLKKARKLLGIKYPHLILPDCFAHQLNLVLTDLFKKSPSMKNLLVKVIATTTWFHRHSRALEMLNTEQLKHGSKILALLRPCETRWTSYYTSGQRLLELMVPIRSLVATERSVLLTFGGSATKANDKALFEALDQGTFWSDLQGLVELLKHLAVACHLSQSSNSRLDNVFLTFGRLFTFFRDIARNEGGDHTDQVVGAAQVLVASLESRWSKMDQEPFIVAALLNPFFGLHKFGINSKLWPGSEIYELVERLYSRVFKVDVDDSLRATLFGEWGAYYQRDGSDRRFSTASLGLRGHIALAKKENRSPDPVACWKSIVKSDSLLAKLALRLYRVCPNSAATEQMFSQYGDIHEKKRNRLDYVKMGNLQRVRANIRASFLPLGTSSRKRKVPVNVPTGDVTLSTTSMMAISSMENGDDRVDSDSLFSDVPDLVNGIDNYELQVRAWQRGLDNENHPHNVPTEEEVPIANVTLATLFDVQSGLDPIMDVKPFDATWDVGAEVLEAETAFFESMISPESDEGNFDEDEVDARPGKKPRS